MSNLGKFIEEGFDTDIVNLDELKKELLDNLIYLRGLSNREYLLHLKYNELKSEYNKEKAFKITSYPNLLMGYNDVKKFIEEDNNDIKIVYCNTPELTDIWTIGRKFVSTMRWKQNPGRLQKFLVYINDKIAGFISVGSDVIAIRCRDEYIGWDRKTKIQGHMINHSAIGTTIVPTQPLGSMTTGGKLLCLLLYHKCISDLWEDTYKEILVGMTTTSLFGINSQYVGFPKYWKVCGETEGQMFLYPDETVYKKMYQWLKINHGEEIEKALQSDSPCGIATGPKSIITELFYRKSKFKEMWKEKTKSESFTLKHGFNRGVFYAKFFENTNDFLCGKIKEKELLKRELDFDRNDINGIVTYWKRKWATNRWQKMKDTGNKNKLFLSLLDIKNSDEFTKKYI